MNHQCLIVNYFERIHVNTYLHNKLVNHIYSDTWFGMLWVTEPPFTLHLSVRGWGILFHMKGLQGRSRPGRLWKLQNFREEFEYDVFLPIDICEQWREATQSAFLTRQRLQVVEYVFLFGQVHFLSCTARLCFSALAERRIPVTHGLVCPWYVWPGLHGILHYV